MTALRELAERWKAANRGETLYVAGKTAGMHACAAELLAILDAEGDGGTPLPGVVWNERTNAAHLIKRGTEVEFCAEYGCCRVFTHPARSGVVRDEEMNRCERLLTACTCHADFKDRDMVDPQCRACDLGVEVIDTFRSMRAALAHPTRDAERLKEIVRRAEKITGSRCVRFEVRFDPLSGQGLNLIDYIDAAIEHFAKGSSEDVRDAERYRWLKKQHDGNEDGWHVRTSYSDVPDDLDKAIDAAMQGERHER